MTTYQFRRGVREGITLAGVNMFIVIATNVVENGFILSERGGMFEVVRKQFVLMKTGVKSKLRSNFVMPNQN